MKTIKLILRIVLGMLMVAIGIYHFVNPDAFVSIMPPYLPLHRELVLLSGAFEIGLGIALQIPRFTRLAGYGLIALYIAVFPANIHMAMHPELFPDISKTVLYVRLPFQFLFMMWAWWYTREPQASEAPAVVQPARN